MAKLQSGIIENFSGSIGDLSFYKWKNKLVVRAKRTPTRKPPTQAQLLAREKFTLLGTLYGKLKESSRIGFQSFTTSMTDKNAFFKYNHSSILRIDNSLKINYPELVLSNGTLKGIQIVDAKTENSSFYLNWKNKSESNFFDKVYIVLLTANENYPPIFSKSSTGAENITIGIPEYWNGLKFHAYTFLKNRRNEISNSQYLGEFHF